MFWKGVSLPGAHSTVELQIQIQIQIYFIAQTYTSQPQFYGIE